MGSPHLWPLSTELCLPGGPGNDRIRMRCGDSMQDPDNVGILHLPEHLQEVCLFRRRAETLQHLDKVAWATFHHKDRKLVGDHPGQILVSRLLSILTAAAIEPGCDVGP